MGHGEQRAEASCDVSLNFPDSLKRSAIQEANLAARPENRLASVKRLLTPPRPGTADEPPQNLTRTLAALFRATLIKKRDRPARQSGLPQSNGRHRRFYRDCRKRVQVRSQPDEWPPLKSRLRKHSTNDANTK